MNRSQHQKVWVLISAIVASLALTGCDRPKKQLTRFWIDQSAGAEQLWLCQDRTYSLVTTPDGQTREETGLWTLIQGGKIRLEPNQAKFPQASPQDAPYNLAPDGNELDIDLQGRGRMTLHGA